MYSGCLGKDERRIRVGEVLIDEKDQTIKFKEKG
jgi:hypothetical protein